MDSFDFKYQLINFKYISINVLDDFLMIWLFGIQMFWQWFDVPIAVTSSGIIFDNLWYYKFKMKAFMYNGESQKTSSMSDKLMGFKTYIMQNLISEKNAFLLV